MALRLNGATSGYSEIDAPAVAGNNTLVLPTGNGSSGQVLTTNGSGVLSWTAGGGITASTAQASTSGTNIDFTGIPSTAKRITVLLGAVSTNGTSGLLIQVGTSSGFTTTGYTAATGTTSSTAGFPATAATIAATDVNTATLVLLNITGTTWVGTGANMPNGPGAPVGIAGSIAAASSVDRIRITTAGGVNTFDAGTINIFYE